MSAGKTKGSQSYDCIAENLSDFSRGLISYVIKCLKRLITVENTMLSDLGDNKDFLSMLFFLKMNHNMLDTCFKASPSVSLVLLFSWQ